MITPREIAQNLSDEQIIQLVASLGGDEYIDKTDYFIFKTICHNENPEDASFKLYYYKKDKRFHCYTDCASSFDIFDLYKKRYEVLGIETSFRDIVNKILSGSGLELSENTVDKYKSEYDKYGINDIIIQYKKYNKNLLKIFSDIAPEDWLSEGISEESLKKYDIKYSINQNKIIIPHYDIEGNLIGIRGRALNEEDIIYGKYCPIKIGKNIYSHPLMFNLYGLNLVKDNVKEMKTAIIVEGEKSCLLYDSYFDKNICVACCGSSLHKFQIDLLIKQGARKILLAFDKEGENYKEQEIYFNKLNNLCKRYKNYCQMGFIYDNGNLLHLKDSPLDRGPEIFKKLVKRSVWIN